MEEKKLIKIGITQGDVNGIGYEVILKAFSDPRMFEFCTPVLYGSKKYAEYYAKRITFAEDDDQISETAIIHNAMQAVAGKLNIVRCTDDKEMLTPGESTAVGGSAALQSLNAATDDLKRGVIDGIVTAPINKHNIQSETFHFPGHTEYLEQKFGDGEQKSLMILMNESLRIALVTGHVAVAEIKSQLTKEKIINKLTVFNQSLKQDFMISRPRIAVLSLNPHAGDDGLLGTEEKDIIIPAIEEADNNGISVFGPFAADGFFGARTYQFYDGILAMYHDQGLAPFKALAMDDGVNFTAGLPIIRTSPAHGTGYDIAGKNLASESSFRHAVYAIIDIFRNRISYKEAIANPLQKQYFDRSGDREKLDLTKDDDNDTPTTM